MTELTSHVLDRGGLGERQEDDEDSISIDTPATKEAKSLLYGVEDRPAVHLAFLFGLQSLLLSVTSTAVFPLIISRKICAHDPLVQVRIISTALFVNGVSTVLQSLVGVRLPIFQGASAAFFPPIMTMMASDQWKCPQFNQTTNESFLSTNGSTSDATDDYWMFPMREIQGSIMLASITQMFLGALGLIGPLLRFVGPLTVTPCVVLIGLALTKTCTDLCSQHWGVAVASIAVLFLFALYLAEVRVPIPYYDTRRSQCTTTGWPIFKLFPVLFMVVVVWLVCIALQAGGVLRGAEGARTDFTPVYESVWFYFPYPGQWGLPTVSVASYVGMLFACLASVIESVGDYHAAARACQVGTPPTHAVNRGILIEGFGGVIAGALGSGGAVTSYSNNIGAITITSMGARVAYVWCGVLLILTGLFGKFGAIFTVMPDPIIGANLTIGLAMVVSVALTNLEHVDMRAARNQCILGVSLMMGLMVPQYLQEYPIRTGYAVADQALAVTLGTPMVVGALLGCLLDNTVPGTLEERGMAHWRASSKPSMDGRTYNLPYIHRYTRLRWLGKLPFIQNL